MSKKNETILKAKKRLTPKQAKLIEGISENSGKPMRTLIKEAGYSQSLADNPQVVLKSVAFKDIFSNAISDKLILKAHKKLLRAKVRIRTYQKGEFKSETIMDDTLGISKGVELAYKVKGAFAPIETKHTITGLESKSDDEINEMLREESKAIDRAQQFKPKIIEGKIVA